MLSLTDREREEICAAWELPEEEIEKELLIFLLQERAAAPEGSAMKAIPLIPKWRGLWLRLFGWIWTVEQRRRFAFKPLLKGAIKEYRSQTHSAVCVEFKYCEKRKQQEFREAGHTLAIAIADCLQTAAPGIPLPVTWLSVYLLKTQMLDRLCKC